MSEELRPCPFCGVSPQIAFEGSQLIWCENADCPAHDEDKAILIDEWNTRPVEDELQRKLDEKLEIIDEQAETIVNFAFDYQHLKAKLDIAVEALKRISFYASSDWNHMLIAQEALKKLEEHI